PGHLPRGKHAGRPDLDLEARRQLDLGDQFCQLGIGRAGRRAVRRRKSLLRLGLVAEEPVIRRMGPEFLGTGFVFLQCPALVGLPLRIGYARTADNASCRKRKNGSMESGCHRVTPPLSSPAAARIIVLDVRQTKFRSEEIRRENVSTSYAGEKWSECQAKQPKRN